MGKRIERLHREQDALLERMPRLRLMYRGTLTEQHYADWRARKDGDGTTAPYFLWQGSVEGKRFSRRVRSPQAGRLKEGIETRHRFEALCAQYVALGETLAEYVCRQDESADTLK